MTPGRRWISPSACAEFLGLSVSGVRKKINRSEIPAVHLGRTVRVDLRALETQLERQMKETR
ncbi:MAG: helix-turn-helix domain-containing protein [Candidatus Aminicenantales bacterium]|jgi:excisionase family DNA binding protein